ncbi:hypothetical protein BV22DRAFT_1034199 [Leucogyrophana mollusca]|uniref:Uncharacterized protein n=1 Tax=Leucogyrophana mollusca TaxID=85980 RepID=A0ACB8BHJ6_9AGAM|nr:hypothetical protein BV22DRAFT_1034199 [Leucogyrophana mollusca]
MESPSLPGALTRGILGDGPQNRSLNGRASGCGDAEAMGEWAATNEAVATERSRMLVERQTELDNILDTHDSMVREVFHLEKFVTLLGYDPKIAKEDNSFVFQEYKAGYDLLNQATTSAGPSRSTRRAHTRRVHDLTASSPSKPQERVVRGSFDLNGDRDMPISAKSKGKQRALDDSAPPPLSQPPVQNKMSKAKARPTASLVQPIKPRRVVLMDPVNPPSTLDVNATPSISSGPSRKRSNLDIASPTVPSSPRKRRRSHLSSVDDIVIHNAESPAPRPRRTVKSEVTSSAIAVESSSEGPNLTTPRVRKLSSHSTRKSELPSLSSEQQQPSALSEKPSIRRVKLIVRRPPPAFSNPRQRAPPAKFGSSLNAFLTSYVSLGDQDLQEETLEKMAQKDAALLERVHSLRKAGRIMLDGDTFRDIAGKNGMIIKQPKRSGDAWDQVVEAVIQRARRGQLKGRHVAAQVASRVQAYWDQYALREDKARAQEEKRLRSLAKATIKMVTSEWKKAVFHIREQERLRVEAEEMRRGHEHLDAILNQSGQILETQQVELAKGDITRSRSRSSSVSTTFRGWGSDESDEEAPSEASGEEEEFEVEQLHEDSRSDTEHQTHEEEREEEESSENDDEGTSALALLGEHSTRFESSLGKDESLIALLGSQAMSESEADQDVDNYMALGDEDGPNLHPLLSNSMSSPPAPPSKTSESPSMIFDVHSPRRLSPSLVPEADDYEMDELGGSFAHPAMDPASPASSVIDHSASTSVAKDSPQVEIDQTATSIIRSMADVNATGPDDMVVSPPTSPATGEPDYSGKPVDSIALTNDQTYDKLSHAHSPSLAEDDKPETLDDSGFANSQQIFDREDQEEGHHIPEYLKPFAVAPVEWAPENKITPPLLLRGVLRPYQQSGLEWLASLHSNNLNGILADEMGLGKTIQTISLLAHLACDRGIWGPHLIIVPTSVLLNWEMEFKKFLPGFKILSYHGTTKRRKELRQGWYNKHHFNVCITSYTLASRDAHIFKRKAWYYMILDEAHMIKNFKSQRWNILLMFRSFRRLLLTGTPLQNNLTELWALLQFLMSGTNFANLKEFGEWFSNPLERAIEMGTMLDDETLQRVSKLHTVLRPYLLRRLKRDVEKELPSKFEHLVLCPLSKRQRYLYDEFMARAHTREALQSGVYQKIANILMQLRKVCNHPDLFEVRPIVTSFAMTRSAVADFEIKELLVRRRLLHTEDEDTLNLNHLGLRFVDNQNVSLLFALETHRLNATSKLPYYSEMLGEPPPKDTRTIQGYRAYQAYQQRAQTIARWSHNAYLNRLRCSRRPIYSQELLNTVKGFHRPILPLSALDLGHNYLDTVILTNAAVKSYATRARELSGVVDKFAFATPPVVALDLPRVALPNFEAQAASLGLEFDSVLHQANVKLQIAFPDPSLLQYDCGKLQELSRLLRERKAGGHRILIFTQMTRILDILEIFLNFHGYLYLRLDGATKIEDRQYITERFNADSRIFCFISSSRSGGVGINLTGADTVVFYDSDFNPQMDRQCEDRAHRIGQIRDVHIYRFVSSHTVEEAMLLKANQKRSLDDLVIQKGEFDWRSLFEDEGALTKALGEFEDTEDAHAAAVAAREENVLEGADEADFGDAEVADARAPSTPQGAAEPQREGSVHENDVYDAAGEDYVADEDEGGAVSDYMISFVRFDSDFFRDWRL